jgi:hypothetical protein
MVTAMGHKNMLPVRIAPSNTIIMLCAFCSQKYAHIGASDGGATRQALLSARVPSNQRIFLLRVYKPYLLQTLHHLAYLITQHHRLSKLDMEFLDAISVHPRLTLRHALLLTHLLGKVREINCLATDPTSPTNQPYQPY